MNRHSQRGADLSREEVIARLNALAEHRHPYALSPELDAIWRQACWQGAALLSKQSGPEEPASDAPFKYRMVLKFDGFERVVEGEYPARASSEAGADGARLLLEQIRREWYRFTSYSQLKADIDHYLDESSATDSEANK